MYKRNRYRCFFMVTPVGGLTYGDGIYRTPTLPSPMWSIPPTETVEHRMFTICKLCVFGDVPESLNLRDSFSFYMDKVNKEEVHRNLQETV